MEALPDPQAEENRVPLNAFQKYLLEYHFKYPGTTMLNLPLKITVNSAADIRRAAEALRQVLAAHPALSSVIGQDHDGYYLYRRPEPAGAFSVEEVSESGLEAAVSEFVRPFEMIGSPLLRCRILSSPGAGVILLDVCHVLCDGFSLRLVIEDIGRALEGKAPREDSCFAILREENRSRFGLRQTEDRAYFQRLCDKDGWTTLPPFDHAAGGNTGGRCFRPFCHSRKRAAALAREYSLGKNGLYIAAAALALSASAGTGDVMFTWTWNGRGDARHSDSAGVFLKDLPVAFHLDPAMTLSGLLRETAAQIRGGVAHGSISYWIEKGSCRGNELMCLIYQGDLYEYTDDFRISGAERLPVGRAACFDPLDIEVIEGRDAYGVQLNYNRGLYDESTMEAFAERLCGLCAKMTREGAADLTLEEILQESLE
jgi:hypothetical protein